LKVQIHKPSSLVEKREANTHIDIIANASGFHMNIEENPISDFS